MKSHEMRQVQLPDTLRILTFGECSPAVVGLELYEEWGNLMDLPAVKLPKNYGKIQHFHGKSSVRRRASRNSGHSLVMDEEEILAKV